MKLLACVLLLFLSGSSLSSSVHYSGPGMDESKRVSFHRFTRQITPDLMNTTTDDHIYYNSTYYPTGSARASDLWFDIASLNETEIIPETGISDSFRVFNVHRLPFDFQFYGHTINIIAVTTAGFLYTSDFVHSRIHLTQYIAPLQADFNPSLNDSARVLIHSSSERFTVQWDRVHATGHVDDGEFRFQVSLFRNGTIHFVYREIPLALSQIESDDDHPVRVGLADSFYVDRPIPPNLILRQVFEYSRITLDQDDLGFSAFIIDPVPNCVPAQDCESCVVASDTTRFDCGWCEELNRCSDGVDRFRQSWVVAGCTESRTTSCSPPTTVMTTPYSAILGGISVGGRVGIAVSVIAVGVLLLAIVVVAVGIFIYGYKHPSSSIGLFMIENRPKARSLNKSKGSYDVDTGKKALSED